METNFNIEDFDNNKFGNVLKTSNNVVTKKQIIEFSYITLENKPVIEYMIRKNGKTYFSSDDIKQTFKIFEII
jgi:hypothetical protein